MHGIMQEVKPRRFRIIPAKPLYYFASYTQSWYRILMLENGYYLRLQITPLNPTVESEWAEMLVKPDLIHWSDSSWGVWKHGKDRYTHTLPAEVVRHMRYSYSDCGDTWRRGQAHKEELERRLKALPTERARIVWKAFVHPYNEQYWRCPV
jgi:hypothetical protein